MESWFFYLFAAMTLGSGALVVLNPVSRNPVTSAMFLVLTMVGLAGLFVMLNAFFLAAVQVLVYAGAVIVLFLFVIMLLDIPEEERRKFRWVRIGIGVAVVGALLGLGWRAIARSEVVTQAAEPVLEGSTEGLGRMLFTEYLLPFEVLSLLLLVAMVGVILLSKKELKA